jgi:acid phosphatase family membrane protein YuiD
MSWELVSGMPLSPNTCVACGQMPRDENGNPEAALFAGGVDYGWGEAIYICSSCQNVIVQLLTDQTVEEIADHQVTINGLIQELKDEKKAHDKLKKRVKVILKGAQAKEKVVSNAN